MITIKRLPVDRLLSQKLLGAIHSKHDINLSSELQSRKYFSTFLKKYTPEHLYPYVKLGRYERQIGSILLLAPCTWGLALAQPFDIIQVFKYTAIYGFGAFTMRSAGCAINDSWDKNFDNKVERTKTRPLASRELTQSQVFKFIFLHLCGGLLVLTQLNSLAISISFASVPLVVCYPLAKRFTNYPQFVLGMAFNWGVFVGFANVASMLDYTVAVPAYLAGIAWTLIYDTIYAHQDKDDDKKIGVKSTALTWGEKTKFVLHSLNAFGLAALTLTGINAGLNLSFYIPILAASHALQAKYINDFKMNDRDSCNEHFIKSKWFGFGVFVAILFGKMV